MNGHEEGEAESRLLSLVARRLFRESLHHCFVVVSREHLKNGD